MLSKTALPRPNENLINDEVENDMQVVMDLISSIRNVRTHLNVPPGKQASLVIRGDKAKLTVVEDHREYINRLARIESITSGEDLTKPKHSATTVVNGMEVFIPLEGLIDLNREIERLKKQVNEMEGRLNAVNRKLENENFTSRAPAHVVEHEQIKQARYQESLRKLQENLKALVE